MDEENLELTDFIKKSVQGIAPEEKIEVINGKKKKKKKNSNELFKDFMYTASFLSYVISYSEMNYISNLMFTNPLVMEEFFRK